MSSLQGLLYNTHDDELFPYILQPMHPAVPFPGGQVSRLQRARPRNETEEELGG